MISLRTELQKIVLENIGTIILGDLNIHHIRWLRYSNDNTPQGENMHQISHDFDLQQLVREPTRGDYLLDLCLGDIPDCKNKVIPYIADHKGLVIHLPMNAPVVKDLPRRVWHFRGAAWRDMKYDLCSHDWQILQEGTPNDATNCFTSYLTELCERYIPQTEIIVRKQTHPWLNDACRNAIRTKESCEDIASFDVARDNCAQILRDAYKDYTADSKQKISDLPRGSKRWYGGLSVDSCCKEGVVFLPSRLCVTGTLQKPMFSLRRGSLRILCLLCQRTSSSLPHSIL